MKALVDITFQRLITSENPNQVCFKVIKRCTRFLAALQSFYHSPKQLWPDALPNTTIKIYRIQTQYLWVISQVIFPFLNRLVKARLWFYKLWFTVWALIIVSGYNSNCPVPMLLSLLTITIINYSHKARNTLQSRTLQYKLKACRCR